MGDRLVTSIMDDVGVLDVLLAAVAYITPPPAEKKDDVTEIHEKMRNLRDRMQYGQLHRLLREYEFQAIAIDFVADDLKHVPCMYEYLRHQFKSARPHTTSTLQLDLRRVLLIMLRVWKDVRRLPDHKIWVYDDLRKKLGEWVLPHLQDRGDAVSFSAVLRDFQTWMTTTVIPTFDEATGPAWLGFCDETLLTAVYVRALDSRPPPMAVYMYPAVVPPAAGSVHRSWEWASTCWPWCRLQRTNSTAWKTCPLALGRRAQQLCSAMSLWSFRCLWRHQQTPAEARCLKSC